MQPEQRIGRYRIVGVIGRGGTSTVYEAEDESLHRRVALKVLSVADAEAVEMFEREAHVVAQLDHPNIVPVYDYGKQGVAIYFVGPYVRGELLSERISLGPMSLAETEAIVEPLASALDYAHSRNVIHGDIKPSNVIFDQSGRPLLTDFGLASRPGESNNAPLGTPAYMSPERFQGQADASADVYALALMVLEMLNGRLLAADEAVDALPAEVPGTVREALRKACAESPAKRFSRAGEFARALYLRQGAVPVSPLAATRSWTLPAVLAAASVTAALLTFSSLDARDWRIVVGALTAVVAASLSVAYAWPAIRDRKAPAEAASPPLLPEPAPSRTVYVKTPAPPPPAAAEEPQTEFTGVFSLAPGAPRPPEVSLTIAYSAMGTFAGRSFPVPKFPFRVGRAKEADLPILFDPGVSLEHFEIDFRNGGFLLRDLGSSNGTYLSGRRVATNTSVPLLYGATIVFGSDTRLVFACKDSFEMPDLTGRTLGDRYLLQSRLSQSDRSAFYSAADQLLPQTVAVKVLSPQLADHPGYREQLDREAKVAAQLRHPAICRVLATGDADIGDPAGPPRRARYIVMDFMANGSLRQKIGDKRVASIETVAGWVDRLAEALDACHRQQPPFVHGGIKPTAIMFDGSDQPCLGDFAFAARSGETQTLIGTPAFLAPEQWAGLAPTPATDQYSLAAVLYTYLGGGPPFVGQEHPEVRAQNLRRGPLPVHELAAQNGMPAVPPAIAPVLARALGADPESRFPSALDFAAAFRKALRGEAAVARPPFVFISYQRAKASSWATLLKSALERDFGFRVFVDTERRDSPGQFPERLRLSIERCDVFVCILADTTLESAWVRHEIAVAHGAGKPMIPILLESFGNPPLDGMEEPVRELLLFDGVKVLDQQGLYIDAAIQHLGQMVGSIPPASRPAGGTA